MAMPRKLQLEIDRCLKKVSEGVEIFENTWHRMHDTTKNSSDTQKRKDREDTKKEIRKLRRLREQIRTWIALDDIKNKSTLTEARKSIEIQMQRFDGEVRSLKTKSFSVSGLNQTNQSSAERDRDDVIDWLVNSIDSLSVQLDQFQCEIEAALSVKKKPSKATTQKLDKLRSSEKAHNFHIRKLEAVLRMFDNLSISTHQIQQIQDDVNHYVESSQEAGFEDNEYIYDDIVDLEEIQSTTSDVSLLSTSDRPTIEVWLGENVETTATTSEPLAQEVAAKPYNYIEHIAAPLQPDNYTFAVVSAFQVTPRNESPARQSSPTHARSYDTANVATPTPLATSQSEPSVPSLSDDAFPRLGATDSPGNNPTIDVKTTSWSAVLGRNIPTTNATNTNKQVLDKNVDKFCSGEASWSSLGDTCPLFGRKVPTPIATNATTALPVDTRPKFWTAEATCISLANTPGSLVREQLWSQVLLNDLNSKDGKDMHWENVSPESSMNYAHALGNKCSGLSQDDVSNINAEQDIESLPQSYEEYEDLATGTDKSNINPSEPLASHNDCLRYFFPDYFRDSLPSEQALSGRSVSIYNDMPRIDLSCFNKNPTPHFFQPHHQKPVCTAASTPSTEQSQTVKQERKSSPRKSSEPSSEGKRSPRMQSTYLKLAKPSKHRRPAGNKPQQSPRSAPLYSNMDPEEANTVPQSSSRSVPLYSEMGRGEAKTVPQSTSRSSPLHTDMDSGEASTVPQSTSRSSPLHSEMGRGEAKTVPQSYSRTAQLHYPGDNGEANTSMADDGRSWPCCAEDEALTSLTLRWQLQRLNASFRRITTADDCVSWKKPPPLYANIQAAYAAYW